MQLRRSRSDTSLSSTARMSQSGIRVEHVEQFVSPLRRIRIALKLDEAHKACLQNLNTRNFNIHIYDESASIAKLERTYNSLSAISQDSERWNALSIEEKLAIENYKLTIMQAVDHDIHVRFYITQKNKEEQQQQSQPKVSRWRYVLFGLLVATEIIPMGFGCFLGFNELLSLIPKISSATIYFICTISTAVECFMYYSMMNRFLLNGLGIKSNPQLKNIWQSYEHRLNTMELMNNQFVKNQINIDSIGPAYPQYVRMLRIFNKDMAATKVETYQESRPKTALRWTLNCINTALNIAGMYFMTHAILTLLAASIVGTPAGWAIIGVVVLGSLAARFAMRQDSVYTLINPNAPKHEATQQRIEKFQNENDTINYICYSQRPQLQNSENNTIARKHAPVSNLVCFSRANDDTKEEKNVVRITRQRANSM